MSEPVLPASQIPLLVSRACQIREELALIEAELLRLVPGRYDGADPSHAVTVVPTGQAGTKYELVADGEASARKFAGPAFSKLFTRRTGFDPVKGFAEVARAVLTPFRAGKLLHLCGSPTTPKRAHLRWS